MPEKKDAAAVALGRKGGEASARRLTHEQRREKARKAARAKWAKGKVQPGASPLVRTRSPKEKIGKLTPREHEVAEYAARGRSNTEITQLLRIRVNTVKKHIGRAFDKLGVVNRTELAVLLMNDQNDLGRQAPRSNANIIGTVMVEAAKEAYERAQYFARRGHPSYEGQQHKANK